MDSAAHRQRMVQLLQKQGVQDAAVLHAMSTIERHRFVDSALVNQAYEDTSLPIGLGQTISKPGVVSRMIELLRMGTSGKLGRVLEIGTGSGYQAAILAKLSDRVYTIERIRSLALRARKVLDSLGLLNINLKISDGTSGWEEEAPFDAIVVTAGAPDVPAPYINQLKRGGRLVIPVGGEAFQTLLKQADTNQSYHPLPKAHNDEVGQLIDGFNYLLDTLAQRESALLASEANARETLPVVW
jgi:protein-L-isoaspartate(D-aspartate) O-methyltransferase